MTITMADSDVNAAFRLGLAAYAAYVDGGIGDQPNFAFIETAFPGAHHLSITVTGATLNADAIDAEQGDPNAVTAADWVRRKLAAGAWRPVVYADLETPGYSMPDVLADLAALGIGRQQVRLWTAHYGAGEHICGPHSCGLLPVDADGTQWCNDAPGANGGVIDLSILRDDFFGTVSNVTDIPLDIRGSYTDGKGDLFVIGVRADGVLCESKRTAIGTWTAPYPIAGRTGAQ